MTSDEPTNTGAMDDYTNIKSLKLDTPHSKQYYSTETSVKQNHVTESDQEAPHSLGNIETYIQKREDDAFLNEDAFSPTVSTPSAYFREDDHGETAKTRSYHVGLPITDERACAVPELVNATLQSPSVMSAVTYPTELATHTSEAGGGMEILREKDDDESAVKRSYRQHLAGRTSPCVMIAVALVLVFLGLAVGLAVSQSRSNISSQSGVGEVSSTTSQPLPSPTTPESSATAPSTQPLTSSPTTTSMLRPTEPPTTRETTTTTSPTTRGPTSSQPPQDAMRVERAEMVLSGAASRLDDDARDSWFDVTIDFLIDHTIQSIGEETGGFIRVNVGIDLTSQTESNDNQDLSIIFSINFDIESELASHNVNDYVLGAFRDKKDEYIQQLQDSDSSFQDVYDVNVSV